MVTLQCRDGIAGVRLRVRSDDEGVVTDRKSVAQRHASVRVEQNGKACRMRENKECNEGER